MKSTLGKRLTALALSVLMVVTMIPAALAEGVITVTVTPGELELFEGNTATLSATVTKDGQPVPDAVVSYVSEAPDQVKVDPATGEVEALAAGGAPVVVHAIYKTEGQPDVQGACKVTVKKPIPVERVSISPSGDQIYEVGSDGFTISATVLPSTATDKTLTWSSSNPEVAAVDTNGKVSIVSAGETNITAKSVNGIDSGDITPLRVIVSGIQIKDTLTLLAGESEILQDPKFGNAEGKNTQWSSSNISVAEVKNGLVSAYNPGTAIITAKAGNYKATCTVTVKEDVASAITENMTAGETLRFSELISAMENRAWDQIETDLEYVTSLSVAPDQGILYYGYSSPDAPGSGVGGSERYYVQATTGQRELKNVVFVPNSDFGGTATIFYTGQGLGKTFSGTIRVTIENSGDVAYNTAENRVLPLDAATFSATFQKKTGRALNYVTFHLPPENRGTLYYNYSTTGQFSQRVTEQTKYYVSGGSMLLDQISFMPAQGYTGVVTIPYQAFDTAGVSYNGRITINVYEDKHESVDDIEYRAAGGGSVRFDADDFQRVCRAATGASLNYIYVSQPSAGQGQLYYKYVNGGSYGGVVSESTRYFRGSTPSISYIDFVPARDFTGTVTIPYTGYSSTGERFQGNVKVRINGNAGVIQYSTAQGRPVDFSGLDFDESCLENNGASLDYVQFELPASREGTLYYNYSTSSNHGSTVSGSSRYSRNSISNITFVPYNGFSGTVIIPYSGYDTKGGRYSGKVEITVDAQAWEDTIDYTTASSGVAYFRAEDFNRICRSMTGDNLDYVQFTLPTEREGTLYHNYNPDRHTGSQVSSGYAYYRSGSYRLLDDVVFVAHKNRTDTVYISYTGRSTGGRKFDGTIRITVDQRGSGALSLHTSSLPLRFQEEWFRDACARSLPYQLSYIQFNTLPSSVYGRLTENFYQANRRSPVKTGQRYYSGSAPHIGDLSFVPRAGFQGNVTLNFTAVDVKGNSTEGKIEIAVSNQYLNRHFTDLGRYGWAVPSIEFLYDCGVVSGYSSTQYGPGDNTTRGAFTMMVCKLFGFQMHSGNSFQDVPPGSMFADAITTAKDLGIVGGYNGMFRPNDPVTREQAVVMLQQAMRVAGWDVSSSSASVLDMYADGNQVSGFARDAMASMLRMGLLSGDDRGNLNPKKPISRAEIAVIMHKMLTR